MLLQFSADNFKAFRDGFTLSLVPAPKQKGLDYSIITEKTGKAKPVRALSTAVIYGPNASGKTNVIEAMEVFRSIVLRGNIQNSEQTDSVDPCAAWLELIPHRYTAPTSESLPVSFTISFRADDCSYEYGFGADLGRFLGRDSERRIVEEHLIINNKPIFRRRVRGSGVGRAEEIEFESLHSLKDFVRSDFLSDILTVKRFAEESLAPDELFLTNGFKTLVSRQLASNILRWIKDDLMIVTHAERIATVPKGAPESDSVVADYFVNEAAKCFGLKSDAIGYVSGRDGVPRLGSCIKMQEDKNIVIPAEYFESSGTCRLVSILPLVFSALQKGGVLVIDQLDNSLHPAVLVSIVDLFHNNDINDKGAQLIISVHNPMLLDANVLRRDEIKFTDKAEDGVSQLYSLSDFRTKGRGGVRKNEDWLKNYFEEKYGAYHDIDFSEVAEKVVNDPACTTEGLRGKS